METRWTEYPWMTHSFMAWHFVKCAGFPMITWSSGRMTRECWAGAQSVSEREIAMACDLEMLKQLKINQMRISAREFITKTERIGFWVRHRRNGRKRARRFASIEWAPKVEAAA